MGTSKSYIAPKSSKNTAVKRGITSNIRGGKISKQEAVSRFATAIKEENLVNISNGHSTSTGSFRNYGQLIGKVFAFISGAPTSGGIINATAQKYKDNLPQNTHELFSRLLEEETIAGTLDAAVIEIALYLTIEKLNIVELSQLDSFDFPVFTKELFANLVMTCFEQRYAAQIQAKSETISKATNKLNEFKDYIYNAITANIVINDINPYIANNDLSVYVEKKCVEIFSFLEQYI